MSAGGATPMIIVKLLTKKRQLVDRLRDVELEPDERAEHEAVLAKIDTALDLLEPAINRPKQHAGAEATSFRTSGKDEPKSRSSHRRTLSDSQHALALVRWRQKVRRNG
jgi:hypothetical protein